MIAELRGVRYRYPHVEQLVLNDVSLTIEPGSLTLLVGKSGSGKSTLLRTFNGLVPHFSGGEFGGDVVVGGLNTRSTAPRDLVPVVGMVFQDPEAQLFATRVDSEIAFSMEQLGIPRAEMQRRVERLLVALGIAHLRERHPSRLSGGERQRVAIAAALAHQPTLLVLDEPTSQLDPWGADEVFLALDTIRAEMEPAIVLAEHRLERSLPRAETVIEVRSGDPVVVHASSQAAARALEPVVLPPVTQLGRVLGWDPIPFTAEEAGKQVAESGWRPAASARSEFVGGTRQVAVQGVSVSLDGQRVLEGLNFEIGEGELVALMGRNGSGKTTLLRSLIGFQEVEAGRITIGGMEGPRANLGRLAKEVGFVPQHPGAVLFRETVARELGSEIDTAVVEQFGLDRYLERNPNDLSGGERERVALAMAMAMARRVLLLDEPTRGMDAWRKRDLVEQLRLLTGRGVTVVLATHDVELVAHCATRVMILEAGRLVADGSPGVVLGDEPAFTPQMQKVFGEGYLTVDDVVGS